jgi:hypothetical protein
MIRNHLFSFLRALEARDYETALDLVDDPVHTPIDLERMLRPFFEAGHRIQLDAKGRSPSNTVITPEGDFWEVLQNIVVDDEISEYFVKGRIDRVRSAAQRRPVFLLDSVGSE